MVAIFRHPIRRAQTIALALLALSGTVAAFTSVALSGTKTGAVLALGLTVGPALAYMAITRPVAFPFGIYAAITPFDTLLNVPQFGTVTKAIGIAAGAALLFYMLRTKRFADPPRAVILWILLFLWMAASMFWAIDVENGEKLIGITFNLLLLYVCVSMMPMTMSNLRIAVGWATAGGIIAAMYGLVLYRSGAAQFANRLWIKTQDASSNPDHYAASMILPIACCLVAILWSQRMSVRIAAALGLAAMLLVMVYTGARGPALGVAGVVVYLLVRDRHRMKIALVGGSLAFLAILVEGPKYIARWQLAAQNGGAGRIDIWRVGWHAFQQNWLFGVGYGNFSLAYDRAFINVFEHFYTQWGRASHNILLNAGVELGIMGLALLLLAWWGQFRILRAIPENDERWPYRLALEGAMIGLFISGMFADIMIMKYVWLPFMLVAFTYNTAVSKVPSSTSNPVAAHSNA